MRRRVGALRRVHPRQSRVNLGALQTALAEFLAQRPRPLRPELRAIVDPITGKLGVIQIALLGELAEHRLDGRLVLDLSRARYRRTSATLRGR